MRGYTFPFSGQSKTYDESICLQGHEFLEYDMARSHFVWVNLYTLIANQ